MSIPTNIKKEHLLKAIYKIDNEGIPKNGDSLYYDVIYNGKKYPPKLIVSYANIFANGTELDRNTFSGGIGTACFTLLEENDFYIEKKTDILIQKIKNFSQYYKAEVTLPHSKELKSYKLLVNEIPKEVSNEVSEYSMFLNIKGSIGQGVNTYYPWLGIFDNRVSSGATNGFYVVLLFSDDFEDIFLTLNQGSTIQTSEQIEINRNFVYNIYPNIEGFTKGKIPEGGLVKTRIGTASKNGKKYEETNIYYKKYKINSIDSEDFIKSLRSLTKVYVDCAEKYSESVPKSKIEEINVDMSMNFSYKMFYEDLSNSGLKITPLLILRFISSLITKPFVILTGLSGSGKTKLAQAFVQWICKSESQYRIVPVGADWTNREPLLGYPNGLDENLYVTPDSGVLQLLMNATRNRDLPYFLILDEMNLSHVERYFADFLSIMESGDKISLYSGASRKDSLGNPVDKQIEWPANLFIIGTVNIDETTYMFSPKVLDRANVIEFRISPTEMRNFVGNNNKPDMTRLYVNGDRQQGGLGQTMATDFLQQSKDIEISPNMELEILNSFFEELQRVGAEFGYRTASEIELLLTKLQSVGIDENERMDIAVVQKLLPKLHGSRKKLVGPLETLAGLCINPDAYKGVKGREAYRALNEDKTDPNMKKANVIYPISFEKIERMLKNAIENGFTSYAEA